MINPGVRDTRPPLTSARDSCSSAWPGLIVSLGASALDSSCSPLTVGGRRARPPAHAHLSTDSSCSIRLCRNPGATSPMSSYRTLLCLSLLCQGLYSGVVFGWAGLQLLLESDRQYAELCDDGGSGGGGGGGGPQCKERTARFSLVSFCEWRGGGGGGGGAGGGRSRICGPSSVPVPPPPTPPLPLPAGMTMSVWGSLPAGSIVDAAGSQASLVLAALLFGSGLCMVGLSESDGHDMFMPGMVAIAAGSCVNFVSVFPLTFLFPDHQVVGWWAGRG